MTFHSHKPKNGYEKPFIINFHVRANARISIEYTKNHIAQWQNRMNNNLPICFVVRHLARKKRNRRDRFRYAKKRKATIQMNEIHRCIQRMIEKEGKLLHNKTN